MVEKTDGNDSNETPKPSMMARLLRFGRNGAPDKGPATIDRNTIGQPTRMRTNGFFGVPDGPSQYTPAVTADPSSNSGVAKADSPNIHKPLPPLPHEMAVERNTTRPADAPIKSDLVSQAGRAPRIHKLGSRLSTVREEPEHIADTTPTHSQKSNIGNAPAIHRLVSSLETIKEEPEHIAGGNQPHLPVDRPIASAENQVGNPDPTAARRPLKSFIIKSKGAHPSGRPRLASFLAPTQEQPAQIVDKSQLAADYPVASAGNQAGHSGPTAARASLQSFIENAGSPNPSGRRGLASLLASTTGDKISDKGQIAMDHGTASAENQTSKSTSKPSRDAPQSIIANSEGGRRQASEPPTSRGLDTQRRGTHQRDNGRG